MQTDQDGNTRQLPAGLVTFVFTDIEASTRLYKAVGDEVAVTVFDRHNEILRVVWDEFGGHEIHTEGDSFFVVFEDPDKAAAACVEVQRKIAATDWPEHGAIAVRIGIHCGLAAPRNDDYMALSVHQAARVMSAASGHQILLSEDVSDRISGNVGWSLTPLGKYRLRDFDDAVALHRVDADDLAAIETPPRATPANNHNLVTRLTSFVGRSADLVAINGLLRPGAVVTVVGLGGIGKTRLATEVGLEVAPDWPAGVWMVELADVADPDLIAEEIATTLSVASSGSGDRVQDVVDHLGTDSILLILDNTEHLIDECSLLVPRLLQSCPNLTVLTTSREPLNCQGETIYRLQPLNLTTGHGDPTELAPVALFIDRAHAARGDLPWGPEAIDSVVEICRHLDGFPLAIEIAAAQVSVLQLNEIRSGLDNRFRLLRSRDRSMPDRHRTMEGLLGWSYGLLTELEQRAFRRLAVFATSFSIDAAEAALAGEGIDPGDVPELIWTLVDKSLVMADLSESGTRYRLLETVQHYAMRLLIDHDDPAVIAEGLADWLLNQVAPWKSNDLTWLGDMSIELANVRHSADLIGDIAPEKAQQLMCSVGRFRDTTQSYHAGVDELDWAVERLTEETPSLVALLAELAYLHLRLADTDGAQRHLDRAALVQERVGPPNWDDVAVERSLGEVAIRRGDYQAAIALAEETLERTVSKRGSARMWSLVGIAQSSVGNLDEGLGALERALAGYLDLKDSAHVTTARNNVAEAAWRLGRFDTAAKQQRLCLEEALAIGQPQIIAYSLIMAARLAARRQDWSRAVLLNTHAESLLTEAGHELYGDEQSAIQASLAEAQEHLGPNEFATHLSQGAAISVLEAAEEAFVALDENQDLHRQTTC